jgi:hypothetical protein
MPSRGNSKAIQWHPSIREAWAGEHLYFWRFAFSPTYDRDRIVAGFRKVLALHGVSEYTIYELFAGGYDVFLRVWLPTSQGAFESDLYQEFGPHNVVTQSFWVDRILVHWPWESDGEAAIRQVDQALLRKRLPGGEIERINSGDITAAQRTKYEEKNMIVGIQRRKGVKFFTSISVGSGGLPTYALQRLENRIISVLQEASKIREKSLYSGIGFGQYLVMGRAGNFFDIEKEITRPLNNVVDPAIFGARTTTYPVSMPDFLDAKYDLRLGEAQSVPHSAAEALEEDESQTLEVKGSAFVKLERWLTGDGVLDHDDSLADKGILKAITGLLNADGGTLLIGALERQRFESVSQVSECPRYGNYIVVGIGQDTDGTDWDRYERRIRVLLEKRIQPDPNGWVSIAREEMGGRQLAVITVRPADEWFYHYMSSEPRPRFWVRQGNRTVELMGRDSDIYRREKPR